MKLDDSRTRRRAFLGSIASGAVALAGCSEVIPSDTNTPADTPTSTATPTETPTTTETATETTPTQTEPAPGTNEPMQPDVAGFEEVTKWTAHSGVTISGDKQTVYRGSQSARVEKRSGTIQRDFPVPIDLRNRDISIAVNIGEPTNTIVRLTLQDTGGNRTSFLQPVLQTVHPQGWVRINPAVHANEANLRSIAQMRITIDGPGASKKYWVDSIRFNKKTVDKGQVMFTFDFLTRSIYEVAFPIMKDRGLKGCVAVPVDRVGNEGRLTRDELTELKNAGWEIASMTNNFASMHGQKESIQRQRLDRAKRLLGEWDLGEGSTLIYPRGACDNTTIELARKKHDVAFLKFDNSRRGHSQSWFANPMFVNRARPNSPDALKNQLPLLKSYKSVYTIWHNMLGSDAENSKAEFRAICDFVKRERDNGSIGVSLPSDLAGSSE